MCLDLLFVYHIELFNFLIGAYPHVRTVKQKKLKTKTLTDRKIDAGSRWRANFPQPIVNAATRSWWKVNSDPPGGGHSNDLEQEPHPCAHDAYEARNGRHCEAHGERASSALPVGVK